MSEFIKWNPTMPIVKPVQNVVQTSLTEAINNPQILNTTTNSRPLK